MNVTWLYGSREDSSLVEEIRSIFDAEFPDINVSEIKHWGKGSVNRQYFIQFTSHLYPKGAHYEYITDGNIGYFEFHLEPEASNDKVLKKIGIRLAHKLQDSPIEIDVRNKLPFGTFWTNNWEEGVHNMKELVSKFRDLYDYIHPVLCDLTSEVVEVSLQSDLPRPTKELIEPCVNNVEVTSEIKSLEEVMNFNLTLPDYQRDYCWEERNISDLWGNLLKVEDGKAFHLGTLIFHANQDRDTGKWKYDIIDGQQRLVTLSLILWGLGYTGNIPLLNAK